MGGSPVWLGQVNDAEATAGIATWIRAAGPGLADPPAILAVYAFGPSRRVRRSIEA
ncbi:hypothetical protein ACGFWD_40805 [Streptomyces sp. NPDC048448]|uniref:hypothetical protein n=1 Tax=unclassified Streptomyces TaxID=2593676 RepID=UPI003715482A